MTHSAQNYQTYRDVLRAAAAPCIPFLGQSRQPSLTIKLVTNQPPGLFLKDLTFIEDGNPALTPEGLINFHKYTMLASTVHEIQRSKDAPYCLQPVSELQEFLATQLQSAVDSHEMWERSCQLEPRGRDLGNRSRDIYTPTGGMSASMVIACMVLDD